MAGDWIKMRTWMAKDPKVIMMADHLSDQPGFMNWLTEPAGTNTVTQGARYCVTRNVTRNVTVALCVTGLLVTWGTAREQGEREEDDLVVRMCGLDVLDSLT